MGAMIRFLFPLIAYFCVATVITVGAGYGYLLHTGNLDDEKLFRIVSILHGVDLDELEAEQSTDEAEVPPEELSYKQHQKQTRVAVLHLQAKEAISRSNSMSFIHNSNKSTQLTGDTRNTEMKLRTI